MGTPEFAVASLDALYAAGHSIAAVFTKEDTPKNRGMKMLPPPVKARAQQLGIPVFQPKSLRSAAIQATLAELGPQAIVVAAYGLMLPRSVLELPPLGCFNVHASLLPDYRGASPINAAILDGADKSGITIIQMDAGLDTGDMLLKAETPLGPQDTYSELHDRLAKMGGQLIVQALDDAENGRLKPQKQPAQASYAAMIKNADCAVDFSKDADLVCRTIRAYDPVPGAFAMLGHDKIKLFSASLLEGESINQAGVIESCDKKGAVIACGKGKIILGQIQAPGGKRMPCADFFRGRQQLLGMAFTPAE